MNIAIELASKSLRTGNYGFGAVIIKGDVVIAQAHDTEGTDADPTAHAEMNVIREASKKLGKNLEGCSLISTHEPCPMCASAIVWSGIKNVIFGYSIADAIKQGRNRIEIGCQEIFDRSGSGIESKTGVLQDECAILYNELVRNEIKKLRNATEEKLREWNLESMQRRLAWFQTDKPLDDIIAGDVKEKAYRMLIKKFDITEEQAPIIYRDANKIVFHSMNFCPTLEACKILELDTRHVCSYYNEGSTDSLVKQVDPRLSFRRNYEKLRPYSDYCEEMIILEP
jgi:tRNA(Arg) A34 adenosine deaminase TadA